MAEPLALVTGAHGFVGRHLARELSRRGHAVVGIGHGRWSREEWQAWGLSEWRTADVTPEALLAHGGDPDLIFHCAGGGSVPFSMAHPAEDFRRTVESTLAVLELARGRGGRARVVLVSSGSVYGSVAGAVSETAPPAPLSPYASHKLLAEQLALEYARLFGVAGAVVRLFSVYGPGLQKQLLWDACGKLSRGEAAFAGSGRETRDFLHVEDAAALLALAGGHAGTDLPVVNGGTGAGVTVAEVVGQLARALGRAEAPRFTGAARPGDPGGFVADIGKARSWGWAPRRVLEEGLRDYAAWYAQGAR